MYNISASSTNISMSASVPLGVVEDRRRKTESSPETILASKICLRDEDTSTTKWTTDPELADALKAVVQRTPLAKYNELPMPYDLILATYIWIDSTENNLRCKDRTLKYIPKGPRNKLEPILEAQANRDSVREFSTVIKKHIHHYRAPFLHAARDLESMNNLRCKIRDYDNKGFFDENFKDLPIWAFDGSSTGQKSYDQSDVILVPRTIYKDPFRRGKHILVMCDTFDVDMEPTPSNHRWTCQEAYDKCKSYEPWFGFEQQFVLQDTDLRPYGWPRGGFPQSEGAYYCGTGADKVVARDLIDALYRCCLYAGIPICGTNPNIMPSQWEFQIGPTVGVVAGDDLCVARYILHRLGEEYNVIVSLDPKSFPDWSGSAVHTNFSTNKMRKHNGIIEIDRAIDKLMRVQKRHIKVYDPHGGRDTRRRLDNPYHTTLGVDRLGGIRVPRVVCRAKKGYLEDRRPSSNCNPYAVINAMLRTCILDE